jgi:hypothetical protein
MLHGLEDNATLKIILSCSPKNNAFNNRLSLRYAFCFVRMANDLLWFFPTGE